MFERLALGVSVLLLPFLGHAGAKEPLADKGERGNGRGTEFRLGPPHHCYNQW